VLALCSWLFIIPVVGVPIFYLEGEAGNDHWVLIWGVETDTHKDGKVDSVGLQETWRFNQDGKANYLIQYRKGLVPPKK